MARANCCKGRLPGIGGSWIALADRLGPIRRRSRVARMTEFGPSSAKPGPIWQSLAEFGFGVFRAEFEPHSAESSQTWLSTSSLAVAM